MWSLLKVLKALDGSNTTIAEQHSELFRHKPVAAEPLWRNEEGRRRIWMRGREGSGGRHVPSAFLRDYIAQDLRKSQCARTGVLLICEDEIQLGKALSALDR